LIFKGSQQEKGFGCNGGGRVYVWLKKTEKRSLGQILIKSSHIVLGSKRESLKLTSHILGGEEIVEDAEVSEGHKPSKEKVQKRI